MNQLLDILLVLFTGVLVLGLAVWIGWRWLKASEDPVKLVVKWVASAIVVGIMIGFAYQARGPEAKIAAVLLAAVCGVILTLIWGTELGEAIARPFANLYDGGAQAAEPQPLYSIAEARRKQGHYDESVREIRRQLEKFPNDFRCWLMLAEIEAENRGDLTAAQVAVDRIVNTPERPLAEAAIALNRLADWQLKVGQDPAAARETLERVAALQPESEQAYSARQRISHLASEEQLAQRVERPKVKLGHYQQNIGIPAESPLPAVSAPSEDPATVAAGLVAHLADYPDDAEARERLAVIYADHYHRLDLAVGEVEQLIELAGAPAKQVAHWLNLLADLRIREGADETGARAALERIVERFPGTASAEQARTRMAHLKLELRAKAKSQAVPLGSYEQNLGLKYGPPRSNG